MISLRRIVFCLFVFFQISLFANVFSSINNFSALFEQKITNEQNQTIVYKGNIVLKKPYFSKWEYKAPIVKTIYIVDKKLSIVDDELEQVTIASLQNQLNFIKILQYAKKITPLHYIAIYGGVEFNIFLKTSYLSKIIYQDETSNTIELAFKKQKTNQFVSNEKFKYKIPNGYDILK